MRIFVLTHTHLGRLPGQSHPKIAPLEFLTVGLSEKNVYLSDMNILSIILILS
jgi:hypothetical protein